jgi:hypothetical protein
MSTLTQRQPRTPRVAYQATAEAHTGSQRWLAAGLLMIAAGLAVVALLGPLAFEVIDYRVTETLRNQTIGLDAVSLFVVAPLALLAVVLVVRGHVAGPALALGIGAYTSYMFVQYILGPTTRICPATTSGSSPWRCCCSLQAGRWRSPAGGRSTSRGPHTRGAASS